MLQAWTIDAIWTKDEMENEQEDDECVQWSANSQQCLLLVAGRGGRLVPDLKLTPWSFVSDDLHHAGRNHAYSFGPDEQMHTMDVSSLLAVFISPRLRSIVQACSRSQHGAYIRLTDLTLKQPWDQHRTNVGASFPSGACRQPHIISAHLPREQFLVAVQMVPEMEAGTYWPADV